MLNMRHLSTVAAVIRSGSVSGAARMLHVTQPAITKSVQLAEEELGIQLFIRLKGRLVPTEEAAFLHPEIQRIFGNMSHLENLAEEVRQGHTGRIALATVSNLSASVLSQAMTSFHARHPRIRFDVEVLSTKNVLERVRLGQVSFGLLDISPKDQGVGLLELCKTQIGCVLRTDNPLCDLSVIAPKDLDAATLITFPDDTATNAHIREVFRRSERRCQITFTVNQTYSAYALIQGGNGVGLLDSFPLLDKVFPSLTVRPFLPTIDLAPTVVFSEGRPVSMMAKTFLKDLQATTQTLCEQPGSLFQSL